MQHTRTTLAIGALATVAALTLTGCSAGGNASTSGPVTLKVWTGFTGGDRPGYATIVKDFEK
ncbi:MAG: ABC transporter substrate-binding protein, partial [Curtobacterium sp.]